MQNLLKKKIYLLMKYFGYNISSISTKKENQDSFINDQQFSAYYKFCSLYTMTSVERMYSLYLSVDYVLKRNIPGDFVECGVWRGGSAMLIALMLKDRSISDRKIYLYDTFEGMSEASEFDIDFDNQAAIQLLIESEKDLDSKIWCVADEEDVRNNMISTGFLLEKLVFIKGKVEETLISKPLPKNISLLRLDTDWYESTKMELEVLYPILSENGVLILDDYGHWQGAKKAVDEYFENNKISLLLNRIDYTGRAAIKTS